MKIPLPGANIFIHGLSAISPQKTWDPTVFLPDITDYGDSPLSCILPDFKTFIPPLQLRRLGRMARMGIASAKICLQDGRADRVDAIITATGSGFQEDMGRFLAELLEQEEQQLPPIYFAQSGYNAMAGMLALFLNCSGYNNNFVSRSLALETALVDATILFAEKEAKNVLLGAFDESKQYEFIRMGYLKREKTAHLALFESQTSGTLPGEGTAFFLLSSDSSQALCRLKALHIIPHSCSGQTLTEELTTFLTEHDMQTKNIDTVISGISGDIVRDEPCRRLEKTCFPAATLVRFKHLTGDYATASSFALWLGTMILRHQYIPPILMAAPFSASGEIPCPPKTILVVNHFLGRSYSFIILTKE
jgi:3-oxoacyl-(acyl-carrier-protein) synthase